MSYLYETEKPELFTEEGQRMFLKIRDHTKALLEAAGAVSLENMIQGAGGGDSWQMLACVDRLVELNEIREIPQGQCAAQHRIFVARR